MTPREPVRKNLFGRLGLGGIRGQIAALVVAAIVVTHLFITATFIWHRPDASEPPGDRMRGQLPTIVQLLGATPASDRPQLLAQIARGFPQLELKPLVLDSPPSAAEPDPPGLHRLRFELGNGFRVFGLADRPQQIGIALPDGMTISAKVPPERRPGPFWGGRGSAPCCLWWSASLCSDYGRRARCRRRCRPSPRRPRASVWTAPTRRCRNAGRRKSARWRAH
jgi:hypothetical protein